MKLVRKDKNQTAVRLLSLKVSMAIRNVFGDGRSASKREERISKIIISMMDRRNLYLECDCLAGGSRQPLNCEVEKTFIRRVKSSPEHDTQCPLYHLRKSETEQKKDAEGAGGAGGAISPLVPVDIDDIFSRKVKPGKAGSGAPERHGRRRRTALKPVPALGRLLFTLLEGAGLTSMRLLPDATSPGLTTSLRELSSYIKTLTFRNGVTASQVITTHTALTYIQQNQMMEYLESDNVKWEEEKEREFFLIGYSEKLEEQKVTFRSKGKDLPPFVTAKLIKTFGESVKNIGAKAPYWVILRFRRGDDGKVYCDEGYAHCAYKKHNPVPVDSEKERETLRTMESAAQYFVSQSTPKGKTLPVVNVKKPLFTVTVDAEDGNPMEVHPDFLVEILPARSHRYVTLVIETMGYDSLDYLERKQRTHPGMSQLGYLITDPFGYPDKLPRTFRQELLSCLFQPERHRQV